MYWIFKRFFKLFEIFTSYRSTSEESTLRTLTQFNSFCVVLYSFQKVSTIRCFITFNTPILTLLLCKLCFVSLDTLLSLQINWTFLLTDKIYINYLITCLLKWSICVRRPRNSKSVSYWLITENKRERIKEVTNILTKESIKYVWGKHKYFKGFKFYYIEYISVDINHAIENSRRQRKIIFL